MPIDDLAELRRQYSLGGLHEDELAVTWLEQFRRWFGDARGAGIVEPNAMIFATADPQGSPSARTVLLKGVDERGFVLYTNLRSRKGREALGNPRAALVFPWIQLQRQVVVNGEVEPTSAEESDAYFAARPRGARLGAAASPQSQVIPDRDVLDGRRAELDERYPDAIPRPEHWGGLRVKPTTVEFWQGRPDRLHDRLRYRRGQDDAWTIERLAP